MPSDRPERSDSATRTPVVPDESAGLRSHVANETVPLQISGPVLSTVTKISEEEALPVPPAPRIGNYEILSEIARGGMGVVYKARQISLDRLVAVKVLSQRSGKEQIHRFRTEAMAAGSLQHPNIVSIHEVGLWQGHHYLVMDYVAGTTLAELTQRGPLPAVRAVRYVRVIAEAVHFAHEHGILHRDLKPSNVLLDVHDRPHVTDFGLAKRLESAVDLTVSGQVLGSPSYMPPEQASGRRGRVGRRSDVYALGALLFHLLTGRPPFMGEVVSDTLRQVLDEEPPSPRLLNPAVPVDLETICLKCLEKDPDRRYPTAQALAEELGRCLRNEPILARPIGLTGRVWRWARRNPRLACLGALVLALLLVIGVGSPVAGYRINQQRLAAVEQTRLAELHAYAAHVNSAQQYLRAGNLGRTRELLELATRHSSATADPRGWEWHYLTLQSRGDVEQVLERLPTVCKFTISPDGRLLALALRYGQVHLWDLSTRRRIDVLGREYDSATLAAFSADSRLVAFIQYEPLRFVFWNVSTRAVHMELVPTNGLGGAFFVPGRPELIEAGLVGPDRSRRLALWDLTTQSIRAVARLGTTGGDLFAGCDLRFTPDGGRLLQGDLDGRVKVFDTRDLKLLASIPVHDGGISAVALSPDARIMATAQAYRGTAILLWDFGTAINAAQGDREPQPSAQLLGHEAWVTSLSFSPDGRLLASGSADHTIRVWDLASRREVRRLQGHENEVYGVQFAPDGRLYSVGRDGLVCAWSLAAPPRPVGPERRDLNLSDLSPSPSGRGLAGVRVSGEAFLFDAGADGRIHLSPDLGGDNVSAEYAGGGGSLFVVKRDGGLVLWNGGRARAVRRLPVNQAVRFCRASPGGELAVIVDEADGVTVWQVETGQVQARWRCAGIRSCALSPDASVVVTGHERGRICVWDPRTGDQRISLLHAKETTTALAFSTDGRLLAAASMAGPVSVWEGAAFRKLPVLSGHPHSTSALAFSPDGRRLATGSQGREAVKLWDTVTWQELLTLEAAGATLEELTFTADGTRLVGRTRSGDLLIWHTPDP